ncbi:MAG: HAD hydrolase family protein [Clostridia bacterium]|nr:HAD hydrolase family protein [Clostridia bacterium]
MIKLIAFDLDGTLTQHKTPLEPANYETLVALSKKYKLLMAGAGACMRIFNQLGGFPIDVIGNYGLQYGEYNPETKTLDIKENHVLPCDRESVDARVTACREKYGFTEFAGDSVQYHDSGCVTFAILGTEAKQEDKLAFDPDRVKRRKIYAEVCETFSDYNVFVGGSSSFDMAPRPFNKFYAIKKYCEERGIDLSEVAFVGDDYGPGGNDESVYLSPIKFITIDDYRTFPEVIKNAGLLD